jgi:hypothetical protein
MLLVMGNFKISPFITGNWYKNPRKRFFTLLFTPRQPIQTLDGSLGITACY